MINNRISYTAALPSDLAVPAFIGSGAALSTAIYLTSQAASPSLPDLSMYNNVSVLLCVGPGAVQTLEWSQVLQPTNLCRLCSRCTIVS